jgi:hypothetical protein
VGRPQDKRQKRADPLSPRGAPLRTMQSPTPFSSAKDRFPGPHAPWFSNGFRRNKLQFKSMRKMPQRINSSFLHRALRCFTHRYCYHLTIIRENILSSLCQGKKPPLYLIRQCDVEVQYFTLIGQNACKPLSMTLRRTPAVWFWDFPLLKRR